MPIEAGKLRHRVTIQKPVLSDPTSTGQRDTTWPEFAKAWTEITSLQGREYEGVRQINVTATHKIHMRYRPDILTTYRVQWGTRILSINAVVDPDNRRRELFLYCTEDLG